MYYRDILKILKHLSDHIFYPGNIIRVLFYHVFTVVIPCPHFDVRENHMVGVIIDRFGKDISLAPVSDTHFHATVNVIASPSSSAGS